MAVQWGGKVNNIDHIRAALKEFLELRHDRYFYGLEPFFRKMNTSHSHIENGELMTVYRWQNIDDFSLSKAIGDLLEIAGDWNERVREIRKQYEWDTMQESLPDDLRTLFGDECNTLEEIRMEVRLILKSMPSQECKISKYPRFTQRYREMKDDISLKPRQKDYKAIATAYRNSLDKTTERPSVATLQNWIGRKENQ